jgi:asparagine synthase (glutamine-hydrolysing)
VRIHDTEVEFSGIEPISIGHLQFAGDVWLSNRTQLIRQFEQPIDVTDLQLLANLWHLRGEAILPVLQGAFCVVIWDQQTRKPTIVRDAVGARTIYVSDDGSTSWISPKLHTAASFVPKEIDAVAMRDYLSCAFVPAGRTLFRNVRELRPGTVNSLDATQSYWSVQEDYHALESESLEWHAERLRALLEEVMEEQLPSGEDVGCYLSGGLDSSCIAALARKLHDRPVHCYSIHFGDECPNELEFSGLVAEHCDMQHHKIEITPEQMWELHWDVMALLDDPIGDPLTVPNLILGRIAKESTNVILNGEGGDPCFGGPKNQPMMLESLYDNGADAEDRTRSITNAYLASFQKCSSDLHKLLKPAVYRAVKDVPSEFESDLLSSGHYVNKFLLINTKYKGADHILTKVNNITSGLGLQARSPLFDRRVVDASLSIPPQYKLKGAQEKAVLKAAVQDLLPERIIARPKSGMMVPVQMWYRKYWNTRARKLLLSKEARIAEFIDQSVVRDLCDYRGDLWGRYGVKLWLLTSLEIWLRIHA